MSRWDNESIEFSSLVGKTLESVTRGRIDNDCLTFICTDGISYLMTHYQDCCESVYIDDICGDLADLVGEPILLAEEVSGKLEANKDEYDEYYTWTFYKLATIKGSVTIKWYGSSNGYYSESVDFEKVA